MQQLPTSCLSYTWSCVHVKATLSVCPTIRVPLCVHKSLLYVCICIPAKLMVHQYHLSRFYVYGLLYDVFLSLGLSYVNWASQECCLFYLRSSLWSSDLLLFHFHRLFPSFSVATTILDSFSLFYLPNIYNNQDMEAT